MERRLTAILAADVVGYCRLMEEDETGTHAALKTLHEELIQPRLTEHRGRIVKLMGDGILAEFHSVVEAVHCAVDLQVDIGERNASLPDGMPIKVRIGISLGDVIADGDDIYGDGVNVASRLEKLAEPGGIWVSQTVFDHVKNKTNLAFKDLGERQIKNISKPLQIYRVITEDASTGAPPAERTTESAPWKRAAAAALAIILIGAGTVAMWLRPWQPASVEDMSYPLPEKPSIAVLPFVSLSDDPEQASFSDAITMDIITDLSKFSSLFVIAANSTFRYKGQAVKPQEVGRELQVRYILEGSVQRSGDQLRINAQLIDAANGHHVWADRYDRPATDLFAVQNEIGRKIVGVIGPISDAHGKLLRSELDRLERTATENLEAYDHYLKGVVHYDKFSHQEHLLARREFERAIGLDSSYSKAIAKKAWTYLIEYWNDWGDDPKGALLLSRQTARAAVEADPGEADAHHALGAVRLFLGKHDLAISSFRKALELNPSGADLMMEFGWALSYSGQPDEALQIMDDAISRNPYYPGWYLWNRAWAYFVAQRYDQAIQALEERTPKTGFTHLMLAVNYAKVGREEDASASMSKFRALEPGYSITAAARTEPFKDQQDLAHYLDALRAVGLPEQSTRPQ